ncbi:hypothetical protein ON010_g10328 [Phytophthora cinnamomi]|nr:hypothetical protein ON010_g10328 [Phytophthora cinnamomi]
MLVSCASCISSAFVASVTTSLGGNGISTRGHDRGGSADPNAAHSGGEVSGAVLDGALARGAALGGDVVGGAAWCGAARGDPVLGCSELKSTVSSGPELGRSVLGNAAVDGAVLGGAGFGATVLGGAGSSARWTRACQRLVLQTVGCRLRQEARFSDGLDFQNTKWPILETSFKFEKQSANFTRDCLDNSKRRISNPPY